METTNVVADGDEVFAYDGGYVPTPATSWGAIIAGAVVASTVSLALMLLGSSFGLAVLSPWSASENPSPVTFTIHAGIWLVIMQWASSALGGYVAGRLRTQWLDAEADEIYFRDTAHGFITWCVATLITAALLTSAVTNVISGGVKAATTVAAAGAAAGAAGAASSPSVNPVDLYVDGLFRSSAAPSTGVVSDVDTRAEATRLIGNAIAKDELTQDDKAYLSQIIVRRTGLSDVEATSRVDAMIAKIDNAKTEAKRAADKARKTAATVALFTVVSMLVGAFIASVAAGIGGRNRDEF